MMGPAAIQVTFHRSAEFPRNPGLYPSIVCERQLAFYYSILVSRMFGEILQDLFSQLHTRQAHDVTESP